MGKQNVGDLEIIRLALQDWMGARLQSAEDFTLGELNFPEASGESSITLIVEATWTESGAEKAERFVLRMVPPESQVFESHDLHMQFRLMEIMAAEGIPAPRLLGYEPDDSLLGSDFYVMHFVDGVIPPDNPPMAFGSWVIDLSVEDRAAMWRNGLEVMARIHCIDLDKHELPNLPAAAADESPLAHEIRRYDGIIATGMRDNADPIILEAWEFLKTGAPQFGPRRLCWGDSRPGNVIWRDLKPVAIIDWEIASIGDPLMDLTWWFWIDHCNSVGLGAEKMSGLPEYADAYQHWHDITGLPIDNAPYYELLAVVRFAIIMERKLVFMVKQDPNFAGMVSHPVQFIAPLMEACS